MTPTTPVRVAKPNLHSCYWGGTPKDPRPWCKRPLSHLFSTYSVVHSIARTTLTSCCKCSIAHGTSQLQRHYWCIPRHKHTYMQTDRQTEMHKPTIVCLWHMLTKHISEQVKNNIKGVNKKKRGRTQKDCWSEKLVRYLGTRAPARAGLTAAARKS